MRVSMCVYSRDLGENILNVLFTVSFVKIEKHPIVFLVL